jgi:GT2 family glycosyltransferase
VSVLMIFLDGEAFMREAVDSLLAQDFADWELLLVDDGSTDASGDYARALAAGDPDRFRYFTHPGHVNRGTSASRNLGLAVARGPALLRLDCDDVLASATSLGEQVALLDAHPEVAVVCGPCEYWNSWRGGRDTPQALGAAAGLAAPGSLVAAMIAPGDAEPISMLVRTAAIRDCGGWDESIRDFGEDFSLTARLLSRHAVWVSTQCWYRYRMHPASYSHRVRHSGLERRRRAELIAWTRAWIRREGLRDRAVLAALDARARANRAPWQAGRRAWQRLRTLRWRLQLAARRLLGRSNARGRLLLSGDPANIPSDEAQFCVIAEWHVEGTEGVQLRVESPAGPMFATGGAAGRARTGDWALQDMLFFLQDASASDPSAGAATLDVQRIRLPLLPRQVEPG